MRKKVPALAVRRRRPPPRGHLVRRSPRGPCIPRHRAPLRHKPTGGSPLPLDRSPLGTFGDYAVSFVRGVKSPILTLPLVGVSQVGLGCIVLALRTLPPPARMEMFRYRIALRAPDLVLRRRHNEPLRERQSIMAESGVQHLRHPILRQRIPADSRRPASRARHPLIHSG